VKFDVDTTIKSYSGSMTEYTEFVNCAWSSKFFKIGRVSLVHASQAFSDLLMTFLSS